jgi:hypothetical protein
MNLRWIVTAVLLASTALANASPRPAVVELFTSQGCSSCPPAEAYLGQLSKRSDVIALAFHVTYWDDLGWRDRFALTESVDRQNVYARNLRRSTVYTPQLIVDGLDDRAGTGARLAASDGVPVAVTVADGNLQVEVGTQVGATAPNATSAPNATTGPHDTTGAKAITAGDVIVVSYLRHAVSAIGRGENAGRKLEEFNIVRSIRKLGAWTGGSAKFGVPVGSLPPDATDVAVLVQGVGQTAIVGAAARAIR